jgi:6-phosphogluconolactonase
MPGACRDGIVLQVSVENLFLELGMLKKVGAALLICASTAMCAGCLIETSSHVLYAALPQSSQIVEYRADPNSGILTQLATSPVTAGAGVQSLAVHPTGKYIYAANAGENDISFFLVEPGGQLEEQTPRTPAGTSPTLLVMDAAGKFLYVANSGSQNISVFSIAAGSGTSSPGGNLTQIGNPFQAGISPLNMQLSSSGNFLYVTGASPQAGTPGYIEVLAINTSVTAPASPLSIVAITQPGSSPYGLAISPNGNYLYTANFGDNTISEFTIGSNGLLTPIPGSPIGQTFTGPVSLVIEPSGKYLYVANQQSSGNVAGYSIGTGGALSVLTSSPYPTGAQPNYIASDPNGNFLFVGNLSKPAIESFCLASKLSCNASPGAGSLTEVEKYPLVGAPTSIVVSP